MFYIYRKRSVLVSNIPAVLGAAVSVLCVRFSIPELLMIGRFITGINCGRHRSVSFAVSAVVVISLEMSLRTNFMSPWSWP